MITIEMGQGEIDDTYMFAMGGDMGFGMYEDFSAIDIFMAESDEYADIRGQFERM